MVVRRDESEGNVSIMDICEEGESEGQGWIVGRTHCGQEGAVRLS